MGIKPDHAACCVEIDADLRGSSRQGAQPATALGEAFE